MKQIKKGFEEVVKISEIQVFDSTELEQLLCGIDEIDIKVC